MSTLSITKGDTSKFNVTVRDEDDVIFDLTGYVMTFTAKEDVTSSISITKEAVISNPSSGVGVITLLPSETKIDSGEYRYDVEISDGTDNVYTVIKNSLLNITDEITS